MAPYYNTHYRMLLRILGAWCKSPNNNRIPSYKERRPKTPSSVPDVRESKRPCARGGLCGRWRCSAWATTGYHRLPKKVISGERELGNAGQRRSCLGDGERVDGVRCSEGLDTSRFFLKHVLGTLLLSNWFKFFMTYDTAERHMRPIYSF